MGLMSRRLLRGADGAPWVLIAAVDLSAEDAADWTGNGDFLAGGITHTVSNGGKCSTLGPDGSTGLKFVQTTTGIYASGTSPTVSIDLSDFPQIEDGGELLIDVRYTADNTPGNNARLSGSIYAANNRLAACGPRYQSSPGGWEFGAFTAGNKFSDYGIALTDSTDAVMTFAITSKGLRWWDRGAWLGAYPAPPAPADMDDAIGVDIGSGESAINPRLSAAKFELSTIRTSSQTQFTVHGYRIQYRGLR